MSAATAKAERKSTNFIAAYSLLLDPKLKINPTESRCLRPSGSVISLYFFVWLPHMPKRRYMGMTDIS